MKTNFGDISDHRLVQLCLENKRPAWEEFFHRFIPHMKECIQEVFVSRGRYDLLHDQDILWNIHEKIVIKLLKRGILRQCTNPSGIRFWLKTVAQNQTRDWLIEQGRKKRLPKRQVEKSMVSLSSPIRGKDNIILEDTIIYEAEINNELKEYLENALNSVGKIKNEKKLWVLRLSVILQIPLSHEEMKKLARFSGYSVRKLKSRLDRMTLQVEAKEEKRIEDMGRATLLWYQIRRLEAQLAESKKDLSQTNQQEIEKLRREIEEESRKREDFLKKGRRLCRPSNRDIAEIVGLAEDKADQISNILIRARNTLRKEI